MVVRAAQHEYLITIYNDRSTINGNLNFKKNLFKMSFEPDIVHIVKLMAKNVFYLKFLRNNSFLNNVKLILFKCSII